MITMLSDQQISNFIRLNVERGDRFHEVLAMTVVFGKTSPAAELLCQRVISTGNDHTPGNVVEI